MDPLSDVLALLKPRSYASGGFGVSGRWAVQFPNYDGIKCYAVISGQGWLSVEHIPDPVQLKAGDCFVLPSGRPFRLATDLTATPVDYRTFLSTAKLTHIPASDGSDDCFIAGGHFTFTRSHARILLDVLPPIVHIQKESDRAALRWCIERMTQEIHKPQPGSSLIAEHVAYMMLIQALRLHLAEGLKGGVGWLFALADKQMSAAITAIHDDPAHRWTLLELARRAGMSRSIFALKFKHKVGTSPMEYLTRWRMLLAADRLTNSRDSISEIAVSLGYESESAFSTAFKRVMGCSPRQYSRGRQPAQPALPSDGTGELAHTGRPDSGADLEAASSRIGA
jgi:AraC-like DNA-binding protein